MASLIWGSYARLVAKPVVAAIVIVSVVAINIGLIIGSEMWAVPLATEISKLWIDPASQVAKNNQIVENFGNKVDAQFNELTTLGNADGSNMLTSASLQKWADYISVVYDTVVFVDGNAYTLLDVCNARLGQSPYTFGCSVTNPLDYFSQGGVYHPEDGTAQFLLDAKIAYPKLAGDSVPDRAHLWAWAINADTLSRGKSNVYQTYFTNECLVTKKIFCGTNSAFLDDVNLLLGADETPKTLKFQLAWAKAQLAAASALGAGIGGNPAKGACTGDDRDVQTVANTETEVISFAGQTDLLTTLGRFAYVDGQKYSMANCAIANTGASCTDATCPFAELRGLSLFNFSSPCASCVMSMMYWIGDAKRVLNTTGPSSTILKPTAGLLNEVVVYDPTNELVAAGTVTTLVVSAAEAIRLGSIDPSPCPAGPAPGRTNISATDCVFLWDKFMDGTLASLQFLATGNEAFREAATAATTDRAVLLAGYGRAEIELQRTGLTKAMMDAQWRSVIRDPSFQAAGESGKAAFTAIRRHFFRPSFEGKSTEELGKILSGFKNDLLTQNLKPAIFGSAEPAVSQLHGGKCTCQPGFAGANCSVVKDDICTCNQDLSPECLGKLLGSCANLASCAGFTTITGLVAKAPSLNLNGPLIDSFQNFSSEISISAAFGFNATVAGTVLAGRCGRFAACLDSKDISASPLSSFIPSDYKSIANDSAYNLALVQDLSLSNLAAGQVSHIQRGALYAGGCLINHGGVPGSCATIVNDLLNFTSYTFDGADLGQLSACFGTSNSLTTCTTTGAKSGTVAGGDASPTFTSVQAEFFPKCPGTTAFFTAQFGGTPPFLSVAMLWACIAEATHPFFNGASYDFAPRGDSLLWPKAGTSGVKSAACTNALAATDVPQDQCELILHAFLMNGIDRAVAPNVASPFGGLSTLTGDDRAAALTLFSGTGEPADYDKIRSAQGVFSSLLHKSAIGQTIVDNVFAACPIKNYTHCLPLELSINAALIGSNGACNLAKEDFPRGAAIKYMEKDDCLTVITNLPAVLFGDSTQQNEAKLNVGKSLARYKFMASVAGACKATGGVADGGGDCWEQNDCNANLNQGNCTNLENSVYLTMVKKLAAITFSNSPEGTRKTLSGFEARYRQLANKPFLDRYVDKHPGRRQLVELGETGPVDVTLEQAEEIIHKWRTEMLANIDAYRTANADSVPDAVSADSAENLLEEISEADPKLLVLGYGMMLLYAFLACTNWSTDVPAMLNGSRALVAQSGIVLVAISVASGLGVSHLLNIEWSAAATQIVPFVMLGLGVSDVFIMLRTFPMYRDGVTATEAAVKGLTTAGPSMLLVTVTNAGVFAVGVLTAMPVVVNFALQAVIVCIANYLTVNSVLPALLIFDYQRQAKGRMDMLPCVVVGTSARAQVTHEGEYEPNVFNRYCVPHYNKCILSIPGKLFILALSTAFIASAIYGTEAVAELGLQLSDIAPAGSDLANALITRDESFSFYTMSIITDEADWSQREVQQGIVKVFDDVMATPKVVDGSGTPWMKAFMAWGLPTTPNYDPNANGGICHVDTTKTNGKCGQKVNCTVVTADASVVLEGKIPFYNSTDFYRCLEEWINSDLTYEALKPGFPLKDEFAARGDRELKLRTDDEGKQFLQFSRGTVITTGLQYNADFVQLIEEVRAVANPSTTPPTFPIGEPIDFWDQYVNLKSIINTAVGYGLLICFISIFILLVGLAEGDSGFAKRCLASFWASALVTGIIAMTVYEIYGYMAFAGLKISAIPAISIIMCTGVAVEYTAYIAVQFVNASGLRNERANHALMLMMAPTIDGAVTMFLGVVMLAAAPFQFIVKYFFIPWLFIIGFGFFNGVAVLPVIFSLVGPLVINSKSRTADSGAGSKELTSKV